MLDTFVSSLCKRFKKMDKYRRNLDFCWILPIFLPKHVTYKSKKKCLKLADLLGGDIDSNTPKVKIENICRVSNNANNCVEFLNYLITSDLLECYPNIYVALRITLTVSVTVAFGERSFSAPKLIKSYLRSRMGPSRLNG